MPVYTQIKIQTVAEQFCNSIALPSGLDRVCAVAFEDNAPSWRNDQLWQAADSTLHYLIDRHRHHLAQVKGTAECIKGLLSSIDNVLDRLCCESCSQCTAPCCLVADVSYDFRDLLIIQLTDLAMPTGQPRRSAGEVCRYLGPAGCLIPRFQRPWICTWYICPVQKKILAGHHEISSDHLLPVIADIGKLRKQVESLFIDTIAS